MLLWEIVESATADNQEVYHWTDADSLRTIMRENVLERGASVHELFGKSLHGVSLSRNPFFDIQDTYAIAGIKAWRIGLNVRRLRQDYRLMPIRDYQYRNKTRAASSMVNINTRSGPMANFRTGKGYKQRRTFGDESEEFCLGDIFPFWHYCTSIAVEARHIEANFLPDDGEDDDDPFSNIMSATKRDMSLFHDILAGSIYGPNLYRDNWLTEPQNPIRLPVPLYVVLRNPMQVLPFVKYYEREIDPPRQPQNDEITPANNGSETRGERSRHFNQKRHEVHLDKKQKATNWDHVVGGDPHSPLKGSIEKFKL